MDVVYDERAGDDRREKPQKQDGDQTDSSGCRSDFFFSPSLDDLGTLTAFGEHVPRYESPNQLYTQEKNQQVV